ncbi:MAG: putative dNA protein [Chloroflexi bacterium]|jgi:DNA-damage-inducible protein D|nr:putative dNA protein [Chloroflexota bacterium]
MSEQTTPFETIRTTDETGNEYWSARDLSKVLGYNRWENFQNVIQKAQIACGNSGRKPSDHFRDITKVISAGKGAKHKVSDYELTRYACYLIVQNSDPNKPIVALGQTYFAEQTRRQELLAEQWAALTEDQKRLALRGQMSVHNVKLFEAAKEAGVLEPLDFAIFNDAGYQGLYDGEKAHDIHKRKGLSENQDILDYMGSEELGANIFRATQADAKIRREQIKGKEAANEAHLEVGRKVRRAIQDIGGTMPEELPTPASSIQELSQKEAKRLKQGSQTSMFEEEDN